MSFDDFDDEEFESTPIELEVHEGVASIKKEPFITIEIEKESDSIIHHHCFFNPIMS